MANSRYLRRLSYPPGLTPLHFHVIRSIGEKGPQTLDQLFDGLPTELRTLTWTPSKVERQTHTKRIPESIVLKKWGHIKEKPVERVVTRRFFWSKILRPFMRNDALIKGVVRPVTNPNSSITSSTSPPLSNTAIKSNLKNAKLKPKDNQMFGKPDTTNTSEFFGYWVADWNKFPSIARELTSSSSNTSGSTNTLPDDERILPQLPRNLLIRRRKTKALQRIKDFEGHRFTLPEQGGKRPARMRKKRFLYARKFNKNGKLWMHLKGPWGRFAVKDFGRYTSRSGRRPR